MGKVKQELDKARKSNSLLMVKQEMLMKELLKF